MKTKPTKPFKRRRCMDVDKIYSYPCYISHLKLFDMLAVALKLSKTMQGGLLKLYTETDPYFKHLWNKAGFPTYRALEKRGLVKCISYKWYSLSDLGMKLMDIVFSDKYDIVITDDPTRLNKIVGDYMIEHAWGGQIPPAA